MPAAAWRQASKGNIRSRTHPHASISRPETAQCFIVMRNDIRELQAGGVAGRVRIPDQRDVVTERNGAPDGGVDAILRLAAADDEMRDIPLFQNGLKIGRA